MNSFDIIGIGAGPTNLSLAALSTKLNNVKSIFFDKNHNFIWHSGMLLPNAKLQVPFLNDLVTLADPTNPFSFLNFLSSHNRLYQFIAANFNPMIRTEFNRYFQWVFNKLPNIQKGAEVLNVNFDGKEIFVQTSKEKYQTRNLVLGSGQVPYIPDMFKEHLNKSVYHNAHFLHESKNYKNKRIAVIGGGQSGAEIIQSLLSQDDNLPDKIFWISKRSNFLPLDDTPFTNEIFTPRFIRYFHSLKENKKQYLIGEHNLANKGISESTAKEIYQRLYELKFVNNCKEHFYLLPSHKLSSICKIKNEYHLTIEDLIEEKEKNIILDKIILCTGYHYELPQALSNMKKLFKYENKNLKIGVNYQLIWEGMDTASIYIQNGAQHTHGVSDSTLSTAAFRSATILNHIAGTVVYPNIEDSSLVQWGWEPPLKENTHS